MCHPNIPQTAGRSIIPISHRNTLLEWWDGHMAKPREPGAILRPGQAAAPCWDRQQAGYPSPGCLSQLPTSGLLPCQGNSSLLPAPTPAGEHSPGCSANMGGPGECSRAWERKENSLGMGWAGGGAAEPRSHPPTQPRDGHQGFPQHNSLPHLSLPGEG